MKKRLSHNDAINLLDYIHSTIECTTTDEFTTLIEKLQGIVPFEYATCVLSRNKVLSGGEKYEVVNFNYPVEWTEIYSSKQYDQVDPIAVEHFKDIKVQYWADTYRKYPPPDNFIKLAKSFKLEKGYTHGARNIKRTEASLFSIAGQAVEHDDRTEAVLKYIVPHLHQVLVRVSNTILPQKKVFLTPREKEVLTWLANGKSSWDISMILSVSESTINFHVNSIMQKLDAVSRTHAVAIAFELGLVGFD